MKATKQRVHILTGSVLAMKSNFNRQFLSAWLRNPRQTGALVPSGSALATAMAAQVEPVSGLVLELGAGTGVITRALLARGVSSDQLVLVEMVPELAHQLYQQFSRVKVCCGDASRLKKILDLAGVGVPKTVVSSLPLLSLPNQVRLRILSQVFSLLGDGGKLIQFTYSPLPPIPPGLANSLDVEGKRVARVPWNLPPAAVWVYRRTKKPE